MQDSRIVAVNHVELETRPGCAVALRWFYGDLVRLEEVIEPRPGPPRLRFRSARLELRYTFLSEPRIESTAHRVALLVDSFWEVRETLEEARVPFTVLTGLCRTEQCLSVLDPGGNRVALRRRWGLI